MGLSQKQNISIYITRGFLFVTMSRLALGSSLPFIQLESSALSTGTNVARGCSWLLTFKCFRMCGVSPSLPICLSHRYNFIFYFYHQDIQDSMQYDQSQTYKLSKLQLKVSRYEGPQKMHNVGKTKHFHANIKENYTDKGNGHLNHSIFI
jgi:hypothetical protein